MIILNSISLLLTLSTTLLAFIIILFISIFVLKNRFKIRLLSVCITFSIFLCGYFYLLKNHLLSLFESYFVVKVSNFFSGNITHTLDSGSFRNYTARIGLHMFYDYPITGVGVGNSVYYMHKYDAEMGITAYGERLFAGSFPQNLFTCVLSEQGLIGGISLVIILLMLIKLIWKNRNRNTLCRIFFIGGLFNIGVMLSIAPIYSLFLWVFLSFIPGYYKYIDELKNRN
jgi:O-antigen ligase